MDKNDIATAFMSHLQMELEGEMLKQKRHQIKNAVQKCVRKNTEKYGKVKTKVRFEYLSHHLTASR